MTFEAYNDKMLANIKQILQQNWKNRGKLTLNKNQIIFVSQK